MSVVLQTVLALRRSALCFPARLISSLLKNPVFFQPACDIGTYRDFRRSAVTKSMDALFDHSVSGARHPVEDVDEKSRVY